MDIRIVLPFVATLALVISKDLSVGSKTGVKIFDEKLEASPAIWRQIQNVTISTNGSEVIGRVVVTDLRPEKDGSAEIVEGGEGQSNVTIELKSPTVFRGYAFLVEVYAVPGGDFKGANDNENKNTPVTFGGQGNKDILNKKVEPNFEQPRTNMDGILPETKLTPVEISSDHTTKTTRLVRNPENTFTPTATSKSNPTVAGRENDISAVKGLEISTPKTMTDRPKQIHNYVKGKQSNEPNKPNIFNADLLPNTFKTTSDNATDIPTTMDRDFKANNEQGRNVRDTEGENKVHASKIEPKIGMNPSLTGTQNQERPRALDGHKIEVGVEPGKQDGLSVLPLNVKYAQSKPNENKTGLDSFQFSDDLSGRNRDSEKKPAYDKFPVFAKNLNTTRVTTETPRNARDTGARDIDVKNPGNQETKPATPKNYQDDKKNDQNDKKDIPIKHTNVDQFVSTTAKTEAKEQFKEQNVSSGHNFKVVPIDSFQFSDGLSGLNTDSEKKPADEKFPVLAKNFDTTKITTETPRNARDAGHSDIDVKNPGKQETKPASSKNYHDDKKNVQNDKKAFDLPIEHKNVDQHVSTTTKNEAKEQFEEHNVGSGDNFKVLPISKNAAKFDDKKPVISIE